MSRRSKYGVAPKEARTVDGITFDSKGEMLRWFDLQLLERAGEISHLRRQPVYPIVVNRIHVCDYVADFAYCKKGGAEIVEDWKGLKALIFQLKRKLMQASWGIDIRVTGASKRAAKVRIPTGRHRPGVLSTGLR